MKYNTLGKSDLKVSEICLGTMTFGQQNNESEAHEQLDHAVGIGINFIDTAEMYAVPPRAETYGTTETLVGKWLKRQQRDKLVVATKIAGPGRKMDWMRGGPLSIDEANIAEALEGSLRRLQTDYVDLYQLHWPERNVPMFGQYLYDPARERPGNSIRGQLEALARFVEQGKIRYVGLSNETAWGVAEFIRVAEECGLPRVATIQNAYSLINRTFESGLAETCHRTDVGLLPYSVLGFGHLSGKYLDNAQASGRITLFPGFGQRYEKANVRPAVEAYCTLARAHGMTPSTLAHAFVKSRWFVPSTIIGATSMDQLKENIAAFDVDLSPEILKEIEAIHLHYTNPAP